MGKVVDKKNTLAFPICVEPNGPQPLDNRSIVQKIEDLTNGTIDSDAVYDGMQVIVQQDHNIYILIDKTKPTLTASWKKVGDVSRDITNLQGQITTNKTAIDNLNGTTDATSVTKKINDKVATLDVTNNTSVTVKGVTVTVNEDNGVVQKPVVVINDGAVANNNGNLVTGGQVYSAIQSAISSTYKVKGSVDEYAKLPTNAVEGDVYNVKAAFTLDFDKKPYPAGTNVVWVAASGSGATAVAAHWDALGGTIDLSPYLKIEDAGKNFKSKQSAVSVTGGASETITALSQDANGKITATVGNIQIVKSQVTDLTDDLTSINSAVSTAQNTADAAKATAEAAVPKTTSINGTSLENDIILDATDIDHAVSNAQVISSGSTTVRDALADLDTSIDTLKKNVVTGITTEDKTSRDPVTLTGTIGFDYDSEEQEIKFTTTNKTIFAEINPGSIAKEKLEGTIQTTLDKADSALQLDDVNGATRKYISIDATTVAGKRVIGATPSVSTDIANVATGDLMLADAKAVKTYVDSKVSGVNVGVTSVGGQTGDIAFNDEWGDVTFSYVSNKLAGRLKDDRFESTTINGKKYVAITRQEGADKYKVTPYVALDLNNLPDTDTRGTLASSNAVKTYVDSALTWEVI